VLDPQFSYQISDALHLNYAKTAIPSDIDDEVSKLIDYIIRGRVESSERQPPLLSPSARDMCRGYSQRMATLAVRNNSKRDIERAMLAVVLGGMSFVEKDALLYMPIVADAARRVGYDFDALIEFASAELGEDQVVGVLEWCSWPPHSKTLEWMRLAARWEDGEFNYISTRVPRVR
jgi:hypothetical protein